MQHYLATGYRDRLACFVFLFDQIIDRGHNIRRCATASHGHLCLISTFNIFDGFGSGYLIGSQVLKEQAIDGIRPKGAVEKITRTDRIYLNAVFDQLQSEGLDETYAAEFAAGVGAVAIGTNQTGLGIDLDYIAAVVRIGLMLEGKHLQSNLCAKEKALVVDGCDKIEILFGLRLDAFGF